MLHFYSEKFEFVVIFDAKYKTLKNCFDRDFKDFSKASLSVKYGTKFFQNNESLTINLGTEAGYSVLDIINKTSEISNQKIYYNIVDRRDGDPDTVVANAKLAKQLIGWEPKFSDLNTIINSTWEIYKSQSFH